MRQAHGLLANQLACAFRAGVVALGAGAIFALAIQPTHGGAEDWFDARAEAILDAAIKAECEDYCLTDRGCYQRCFDAKYEEVLYEFDGATWQQRDSWLDNLAKKLRPELMSPRAKESERQEKARQECFAAAPDYDEASRRCIEQRWRALEGETSSEEWSAANRASSACHQRARDARAAALERCRALYPQ